MPDSEAIPHDQDDAPSTAMLDRVQRRLERGEVKSARAALRKVRLRQLTAGQRMRYHYLSGWGAFEQGQYSEAERELNNALARAEALAEREYAARIRYRIGVNLYRQRRFAAAEHFFALCHSATQAGDVRDLLFRMYVDHSLANCAARQGRYAGAISHYRDALSYVSDVDDPKWVSTIYWGLGLAYLGAGEAAQAKIALEESLRLAEDAASETFLVEISAMYAVALIELNQPGAAERELERTIYLSRQVGNQRMLAIAYACLAEARLLSGRLDEALNAARQGIAAAASDEVSALDRAQVELVLAKVYTALGERGAAEALFAQAETGMKDGGDNVKFAALLHEYARALRSWGEDAQAAEKEALALGLLHPDWVRLTL